MMVKVGIVQYRIMFRYASVSNRSNKHVVVVVVVVVIVFNVGSEGVHFEIISVLK